MSRNYSPKTFLRSTPNRILKRYFDRQSYSIGVDLDSLNETEVEPIIDAIDDLSEGNKRHLEADFRMINELACKVGREDLIEEARFHNLDWATTFEDMKNNYECSFWAFLEDPDIFTHAADFVYMDSVGGWKQVYVGEDLEPAVDQEDLDHLSEELRRFYKRQGRGRHCEVDNYWRPDPERHCYFAYPEDFANEEVGYDEAGRFARRLTRPALEVIFIYKPGHGLLEVRAKGKNKDIEELQEIFARTILGLDEIPETERGKYELSKLKKKGITFRTDPQDGIDEVKIMMLRLDLPGGPRRRIIIDAEPAGSGQAVHLLMERALNKQNVPLDEIEVAKAKLRFRFRGVDGRRGKTVTFEISTPDRCTLKDDPLHQIAKKYLSEWGLLSG